MATIDIQDEKGVTEDEDVILTEDEIGIYFQDTSSKEELSNE